MENVLIIGNGFDIDLGLITRYPVFYISEEFNDCINAMKTNFGHSFGETDSSFFYDVFSIEDARILKVQKHRKVSLFYFGEEADVNLNLNEKLLTYTKGEFRLITSNKYKKNRRCKFSAIA